MLYGFSIRVLFSIADVNDPQEFPPQEDVESEAEDVAEEPVYAVRTSITITKVRSSVPLSCSLHTNSSSYFH